MSSVLTAIFMPVFENNMYTRIKKSIRPRRKQDFAFPDGTSPEPKQWIEGGRVRPDARWILDYWGRWDRARLNLEIAEWERKGMLVYTPRIYYKIELRETVRIAGKPIPKTLKTWFIQERDFISNSLREFWQGVSTDLRESGVTRLEATRIKEKIAELIPMA